MFKKILQYTTVFILAISIFGTSIIGYASSDSYGGALKLSITDPYICGGDITSIITGGEGYVIITTELVQKEKIIKSYKSKSLKSGAKYTIPRPDKDVPDGKYLVRFSALDSAGNTDKDEYQAEILDPSKCPLITTIRTGASKIVKDNLFLVSFSVLVSSSAVMFLIKNRKMRVER